MFPWRYYILAIYMDKIEIGNANHSSILAWKIPWTEEPGRLQPVGSQRFGHDYSNWAEKAVVPYSSTLAWKIPWMEESGRLHSIGSLRVGPDWVTSLSLSTFWIEEGNGNPLQCSCLENPRDGGAWWAAVYGVTQSRTRLKWLSSSSSSSSIALSTWIKWCLVTFVSLVFYETIF